MTGGRNGLDTRPFMLKHDFVIEFERLCKGFRYNPTTVQVEAWFERVGRTAPAVWREAVTALLCHKYFPKLEDILDAIEREAERSRKSTVLQDQIEAARTVAQLQREPQKDEDLSRVPTPGTPLFNCIQTLARRNHVRIQLVWVERHQSSPEAKILLERDHLLELEMRLTQDVVQLSKRIHPDDLRRLLKKYEPQSAAVAS